MAVVQVASDDGLALVLIVTDDDGHSQGVCRTCGEVLDDRGHFEDTVQAAEIHVDQRH